MRHFDNTRHNRRVVLVPGDIADKRYVNLDLVNRQQLQIRKRRMSRSEIIYGYGNAHFLEVAQDGDQAFVLVQHHAFRQFQFQVASLHAGFLQYPGNLRHDFVALQLQRRHIDRDMERREAGLAPGYGLLACRAEHPLPERDNQAGCFCQRNELNGAKQPEFRVLPADQRLGAHDLSRITVNFGLVMQHEFRLVLQQKICRFHSLAERCLQSDPLHCFGMYFGRVQRIGIPAIQFRLIHGTVRVHDQTLYVTVVKRVEGDADTAGDIPFVLTQLEGLPDRMQDFFGDVFRISHTADAFQYDRKLVAPETGHGIFLAQQVRQAFCGFLQQQVAEEVAECVIDVLEVVKVEK